MCTKKKKKKNWNRTEKEQWLRPRGFPYRFSSDPFNVRDTCPVSSFTAAGDPVQQRSSTGGPGGKTTLLHFQICKSQVQFVEDCFQIECCSLLSWFSSWQQALAWLPIVNHRTEGWWTVLCLRIPCFCTRRWLHLQTANRMTSLIVTQDFFVKGKWKQLKEKN